MLVSQGAGAGGGGLLQEGEDSGGRGRALHPQAQSLPELELGGPGELLGVGARRPFPRYFPGCRLRATERQGK